MTTKQPTAAEAAAQLGITPAGLRVAAHQGYLRLRRPTPEERAVLVRALDAQGGTSVVDADELERYRLARRLPGRPKGGM